MAKHGQKNKAAKLLAYNFYPELYNIRRFKPPINDLSLW